MNPKLKQDVQNIIYRAITPVADSVSIKKITYELNSSNDFSFEHEIEGGILLWGFKRSTADLPSQLDGVINNGTLTNVKLKTLVEDDFYYYLEPAAVATEYITKLFTGAIYANVDPLYSGQLLNLYGDQIKNKKFYMEMSGFDLQDETYTFDAMNSDAVFLKDLPYKNSVPSFYITFIYISNE